MDVKGHGWLMKGGVKGGNLLSPALLHKFLEEREKTPELSLHESAVTHHS